MFYEPSLNHPVCLIGSSLFRRGISSWAYGCSAAHEAGRMGGGLCLSAHGPCAHELRTSCGVLATRAAD